MWATFAVLLQVLLLLLGLFLIVVILLQRGRGGGLAGAFGGLGGQSAFGTRAGDVFTWITTGAAVIWVILAGLSGIALRAASERCAEELGEALPATPGIVAPSNADQDPLGETDRPLGQETNTSTRGSAPGQPAETPPGTESPGTESPALSLRALSLRALSLRALSLLALVSALGTSRRLTRHGSHVTCRRVGQRSSFGRRGGRPGNI